MNRSLKYSHFDIAYNRGSIYVLTLLTVAAVGSMILIGVSLRGSRNSQSVIIEQINSNSTGVLDAAELAIAKIESDDNWNTNAQKGMVFADFTLGDRSYTSAVVDADTSATVTSSTTAYKVTVSASTGLSKESATVEVVKDNATYLETVSALGATHYWPLNEAPKSTSAVDGIGTLDATFMDPEVAGAATNDEGGIVPEFAKNADHVEVPHHDEFKSMSQGSISLWLKLTDNSNFTVFGVTGKYEDTDGYAAMSLTIIAKSLNAYLEGFGTFSYSNVASSSPGVIKLDQWHHVVMSWGSRGLRVYLDGSLVASNSQTDGLRTFGGRWGSPLLIGAGYMISPSSQPMTGFPGSIAHYAVIPSQLTDDQISDLAAIKPDLERNTFMLVEDSWNRFYE